jgi:mannosyl-oligosaccharide alpha-1,2-mannosidase
MLPRVLRGRVLRNAILAVIGVLLIYRYLSSTDAGGSSGWSGGGGSEFASLTRFMNSDIKDVVGNKTVFDWGLVPKFVPKEEDETDATTDESEKVLSDAAGKVGRKGKAQPKRKPITPSRKRPRIQHVVGPESSSARQLRESRRDDVRAVFRRDWALYREHAWGMDSLLPLTLQGTAQFCGWAATLVDALDTLWIMGLRAEFDEAVAHVATIDFGSASCGQVNTFETTIRYLGGLLGAYDLSGREVLLRKAVELGNMLVCAFNTKNGMPVDFMLFANAKTGTELSLEASVVSASPGTLSLELAHLSQVTGNDRYYEAVRPVMELFARHQNETRVPGLWPMYVSMAAMDVTMGGMFTLSGGADSLYEYLPKMHSLLLGRPEDDGMYENMTLAFLDAANKTLVFRPMAPGSPDILVSGYKEVNADGKGNITAQSEHLACFIGGVWALSGRLFDKPKLVETGTKMARGCAWTYSSMPTGVGPERFNLVPCPAREKCDWDEDDFLIRARSTPQWREGAQLPPGFVEISDKRYILRPEAIESVFVSWRITGQPEFQEAAWKMWKGVKTATTAGNVTAAVKDVVKRGGEMKHENYMESFWFAETLKYFYLAFSDPSVVSLDEYVLNTEAHPFRLR